MSWVNCSDVWKTQVTVEEAVVLGSRGRLRQRAWGGSWAPQQASWGLVPEEAPDRCRGGCREL